MASCKLTPYPIVNGVSFSRKAFAFFLATYTTHSSAAFSANPSHAGVDLHLVETRVLSIVLI